MLTNDTEDAGNHQLVHKSDELTRLHSDHVKTFRGLEFEIFLPLFQKCLRQFPAGIGEPDFITPGKIREASIFALEKGKTSYTDNRGLLSLRKKSQAMLVRSLNYCSIRNLRFGYCWSFGSD